MGTQPPNESLVQRYKFAWRFLLISNLALGAYIFASARKKDTLKNGKAAVKVPSAPNSNATTIFSDEPVISPTMEPLKVHQPSHEGQRHELFK